MVQIAGMQFEIIGMYRNIGILELDDDLDAFALVASGKIEQGVFIEAELGKYTIQACVSRWHKMILMELPSPIGHSEHKQHADFL